MNVNLNTEKSENLHFDGIFFLKYVTFELKQYRQVVSWKITYGFKNDIRNLVNFDTSS